VKRFARSVIVVVLGLIPASAFACPVCFSGSPKIRMAFFGTTILLSLLPLGMIGAGVAWLKRLGGGAWAAEFEDRDEG